MAQIDPVVPDDYDELARFLADFEDDGRDHSFWLRHFRFWWDANPALTGAVPRGWVVRDGAIGGFLGNVPSYFQLDGREVVVHNSTTWRVAPDYRPWSLALFERLIDQSRSTILLNTTPIESVALMMQALSFKLLPRDPFPTGLAVVDFDSFLNSRINNPLLRSMAALGGRMAASVRGRARSAGTALTVKLEERADASFDALWARTRHQFAHTNARAARDVNWFCFENDNHPKLLLAAYDGERLVGFAALRAFRGFERPKDRLECLDLWVDREVPDATPALVRGAVDLARSQSLEAVLFPCFNEQMVDACKRLGLWVRAAEPARDYAKMPLEAWKSVRAGHAYFVISQGDYGYY